MFPYLEVRLYWEKKKFFVLFSFILYMKIIGLFWTGLNGISLRGLVPDMKNPKIVFRVYGSINMVSW